MEGEILHEKTEASSNMSLINQGTVVDQLLTY